MRLTRTANLTHRRWWLITSRKSRQTKRWERRSIALYLIGLFFVHIQGKARRHETLQTKLTAKAVWSPCVNVTVHAGGLINSNRAERLRKKGPPNKHTQTHAQTRVSALKTLHNHSGEFHGEFTRTIQTQRSVGRKKPHALGSGKKKHGAAKLGEKKQPISVRSPSRRFILDQTRQWRTGAPPAQTPVPRLRHSARPLVRLFPRLFRRRRRRCCCCCCCCCFYWLIGALGQPISR